MAEREPTPSIHLPKTSQEWEKLFEDSAVHVREIKKRGRVSGTSVSAMGHSESFSWVIHSFYETLEIIGLAANGEFTYQEDFVLTDEEVLRLNGLVSQLVQYSEIIETVPDSKELVPFEMALEDRMVDIIKIHDPQLKSLDLERRMEIIANERRRLAAIRADNEVLIRNFKGSDDPTSH